MFPGMRHGTESVLHTLICVAVLHMQHAGAGALLPKATACCWHGTAGAASQPLSRCQGKRTMASQNPYFITQLGTAWLHGSSLAAHCLPMQPRLSTPPPRPAARGCASAAASSARTGLQWQSFVASTKHTSKQPELCNQT